MPVTNISSASLWAVSGGQHQISVTVARPGGRGWAFAETALARVGGTGTTDAWISAIRYQPSADQIFNALYPDPGGASSARWISDCLSSTFTVRVNNKYAYAIAKVSSWQ